MKRWALILIAVILLISISGFVESVEEKKILNEWVRYDHSFSYEGEQYSITTLETGDMNNVEAGRIAIRAPNHTVILNFGECKETKEYKYCFENVTFEGDKIDIDDMGQTQPGLKLSLIEYLYLSDVKVVRWFEKSSFNLYESGDVAITIENTGDKVVENIVLKESIPKGFSANSKTASLRVINKNEIEVGPLILYPEKQWTGKYTLTANNYSEGEYQSKVTYDSGNETGKEAISDKTKIKVLEPYKLTVTQFDKSFDTNSDIEYKITIENKENKRLYINDLKIFAPLNMRVLSTTGLSKSSNNRFKLEEGYIDEGETKTYSVRIKPLYNGRYSVSYYLDFDLKDKNYVHSARETLVIQTEGVSCYFSFDEEEELSAGKPFIFNISIENNDDKNYYEFKGEIINSLGPNIPIDKTNIEKGKLYTIPSNRIILPLTEDNKTYNLSMKVNYRSLNLEPFKCESTLPIFVKGGRKYLDAGFEIKNSDIAVPGEEVEIIFFIENLIGKDFSKVFIEHELMDEVQNTGFSRENINLLKEGEKIEAYTTKINIPKNYSKEYFEIMISVGAQDPNYEDSMVIKIPVNQTNNPNAITEDTQAEKVIKKTENSNSKDEKVGFIDTVINFFTDLFSKKK